MASAKKKVPDELREKLPEGSDASPKLGALGISPENRTFLDETAKGVGSIPGKIADKYTESVIEGLPFIGKNIPKGEAAKEARKAGSDFLESPSADGAIGLVRRAQQTWGASEEKPKTEEAPSGDLAFVDRQSDNEGRPARVIPAHDADLVNPMRGRREQDAFGKIQSGYRDQQTALEGQKKAEDDIADARVTQNVARAAGNLRLEELADRESKNVERRATDDRIAQDSFRAKMDAFSRDLADEKIEYKSSIPQKVTWGLASLFGSIQQGLQHLPSNQIADQIDSYIKRDLDLQKTNRAGKRERFGDMQKFYDMAASQSKDQNERSRLAYGYALEATKAHIDALAAASADPLVLAEAKKQKALIDEKQAQIKTVGEYGTELLASQADIRNHKWVQAGVEGGGGKPVNAERVFFDPDSKSAYAARTEDGRKKLVASGTTLVMMKKLASDYADSVSKLGVKDRGQFKLMGVKTPAMKRALGNFQKIRGLERQAQNTGVYNPSEEGLLSDILTNPADLLDGSDPDESLRVITDYANSQHRALIKNEAPDRVDRVEQPYGTAPKNVPDGRVPQGKKDTPASAAGFVDVVPGAKAKGGDVEDEQPYLVGEEGPELVVPNKPGFVLTALQTAALKGAPPTKQQVDTLPKGVPPKAKTAIERYAEKMGVAREDGGAVTPAQKAAYAAYDKMTPEQQRAEDERTAREFMPPDTGQARTEKPKTADEAQWERQQAAYEKREGERVHRLAQEAASAAARREAEADAQRLYDDDRTWHEGEPIQKKVLGPIAAWANKVAGKYDVMDTTEMQLRAADRAERSKDSVLLRYAKWVGKDRTDPVPVPSRVKRILDMTKPGGPKTREPVSFERDVPARAEGGEVLPLYEPEGKELHQSADGHAYLASNDEARPSGASLSGTTPRYSAHPPTSTKAAAPPPRKQPVDMMRLAEEMERSMRADHEARMAEGPAVKARAYGGAMQPKGLAATFAQDMKKTKRKT